MRANLPSTPAEHHFQRPVAIHGARPGGCCADNLAIVVVASANLCWSEVSEIRQAPTEKLLYNES